MIREFEAVFENGLLRPLEPLDLAEHGRVRVSISPPADSTAPVTEADLAAQQKTLDRLAAILLSLPVNNPDDGFSSRDHDAILYGWKK